MLHRRFFLSSGSESGCSTFDIKHFVAFTAETNLVNMLEQMFLNSPYFGFMQPLYVRLGTTV